MKRTRTTIRIDDNLKTRIQLLSIKNNISFNKMIIYILEIGYQNYIRRFDSYDEKQSQLLEGESNE